MLYIKIKNLSISLNNSDILSKNDNFIKIIYGTDVRTTTVKWNKDNPIWDEIFLFKINFDDNVDILLELCEQNPFNKKIIKRIKFKPHTENIRLFKKDIVNIEMGNIYWDKNIQIANYENKIEEVEKKLKNIKDCIEN